MSVKEKAVENNLKIDDTTGLPELPAGHFWRVKFKETPSNYYTDRYLYMEIRNGKKRVDRDIVPASVHRERDSETDKWKDVEPKKFGTNWGNSRPMRPEEYRELVWYTAQVILNNQKAYIAKKAKEAAIAAEVARLAGDYPPKVLS